VGRIYAIIVYNQISKASNNHSIKGGPPMSDEAVVEIISKALTDEDYRAQLFNDTEAAIGGYDVTEEERSALHEMKPDSFDFFANEVESRISKSMFGTPEIVPFEPENVRVMEEVVTAVWRDLNPGGLAYILAYKIPNKYV